MKPFFYILFIVFLFSNCNHLKKVPEHKTKSLPNYLVFSDSPTNEIWEVKENYNKTGKTMLYKYRFFDHKMDSIFWIIDMETLKIKGKGLLMFSPWYNRISSFDFDRSQYFIESYSADTASIDNLWPYRIYNFLLVKARIYKIEYYGDDNYIDKIVFYDGEISPQREINYLK